MDKKKGLSKSEVFESQSFKISQLACNKYRPIIEYSPSAISNQRMSQPLIASRLIRQVPFCKTICAKLKVSRMMAILYYQTVRWGFSLVDKKRKSKRVLHLGRSNLVQQF